MTTAVLVPGNNLSSIPQYIIPVHMTEEKRPEAEAEEEAPVEAEEKEEEKEEETEKPEE